MIPAACVALALLIAPLALSAQAPGTGGEEPVRLETSTGTLHGTLLLPAGGGPVPVALLIAGSGPTDRDGNSAALPGKNNSLKLLAEGLAARGIASVRYDKRGIGESRSAAASEVAVRFDHFVDDAAAWVRQLDADPRFASVAVVGHSEGSLIGMLAAQRAPADAVVSIAGPARRASDILRDQLRGRLPAELAAQSEHILTRLEAGETVDSVPAPLMVLYRPSVQPYLASWMRYTPAEEVARLTVPVLVVQGTTDLQVPVEEARSLQAALPTARLAVVEGMNHVLKPVPADPARQQASYADPALPVAPGLVEAVADFLLSRR